jgi:hypothetical protein
MARAGPPPALVFTVCAPVSLMPSDCAATSEPWPAVALFVFEPFVVVCLLEARVPPDEFEPWLLEATLPELPLCEGAACVVCFCVFEDGSSKLTPREVTKSSMTCLSCC